MLSSRSRGRAKAAGGEATRTRIAKRLIRSPATGQSWLALKEKAGKLSAFPKYETSSNAPSRVRTPPRTEIRSEGEDFRWHRSLELRWAGVRASWPAVFPFRWVRDILPAPVPSGFPHLPRTRLFPAGSSALLSAHSDLPIRPRVCDRLQNPARGKSCDPGTSRFEAKEVLLRRHRWLAWPRDAGGHSSLPGRSKPSDDRQTGSGTYFRPRVVITSPLGDLTQPGPILASVSRSFFLSLRFLPASVRPPLCLGYLLARISDTIADTPGMTPAHRLSALDDFERAVAGDWSRLSVVELGDFTAAAPSERDLLRIAPRVVDCLHAQPIEMRQEIQRVMSLIVEGQRKDLTRFGDASQAQPSALKDAAELEAYTYLVAGCVGEFWTRICQLYIPRFAKGSIEELQGLGRDFGQGLQLVNILRDLPADLAAGRCYLPADALTELGVTPATLPGNPTTARPLVHQWMSQAERWLQQGAIYEEGIRGVRLRFSVSLPRRLGLRTLEALERTPPLETVGRVKIGRKAVLRCAARSFLQALLPIGTH